MNETDHVLEKIMDNYVLEMNRPSNVKLTPTILTMDDHIDLTAQCIMSSYATTSDGYARKKIASENWLHHRWVYFQSTGIRPEVVLQLCGNRRCVCIAHLSQCSLRHKRWLRSQVEEMVEPGW